MQFKLFKNKNIIYGISDSSFGSMRRSNKNALKFLKSLGIQNPSSKKIVWAQQVFGAKVHICLPNESGIIKGVDGLISNNPKQILAVVSADCVPVLLFDFRNRVIAALHGSRESLVKGIIQNAISKMVKRFGSNPKDILVGIGPHIRVCHYWLKPKTYQKLKTSSFKKFFVKKEGKTYFDLTKLTITQLKKLGIPNKNIEDCKICTFCHYRRYFSARKQEASLGVYREKQPVFMTAICLS
jgi:hypothetical protein